MIDYSRDGGVLAMKTRMIVALLAFAAADCGDACDCEIQPDFEQCVSLCHQKHLDKVRAFLDSDGHAFIEEEKEEDPAEADAPIEPPADRDARCALATVAMPTLPALRNATEHVVRHGLARLPDVLPTRLARTLRGQLVDVLQAHPGFYGRNGCIGLLDACRYRYDVPLTLDAIPLLPKVMAAVGEALEPLLTALVGADGELVEFSGMLTCNGSPAQELHSDTFELHDSGRRLYSIFVALQDVDGRYGATQTVAGSHINGGISGDWEGRDVTAAALPCGAALIYDSRLVHGAGVNQRGGRAMLILSVQHAGGAPLRPAYVLHRSLRRDGVMGTGRVQVRELVTWAVRGGGGTMGSTH